MQLLPQSISITRELVSKFLDHQDYSVQKKVYRLLLCLIHKSGAKSLDDAMNIYKWIEETKQPIAKIGRVRIITEVIGIMVKMQEFNKFELTLEVESLLNSLLPELIICAKAKHKKTSSESLAAIVKLSHLLSSKGVLVSMFTKLLAGLAGKSVEFRVGTVVLLGRLLYEHHDELTIGFIMEISNLIIILLKDQDKKIVTAVMNYIKILVTVLSREQIEACIDLLVNGLLVWTGKFKQDLRMKIRYILKKVIKKTSGELVKSKTVHVDQSLIDYICKMIKREKRDKKKQKMLVKSERQIKENSKKQYENIIKEDESEEESEESNRGSEGEEDISESGSDIPEEDIPILENEDNKEGEAKKLEIETMEDKIEKMLKGPESEIETHFYEPTKKVGKTKQKKEEKKVDKTVYISKDKGKIVVNEDEEEEEHEVFNFLINIF